MANINLLSPLDQPLNNRRLVNDLKDALNNTEIYSELRIVVAYAKSGVIKRLEDELKNWSSSGNTISAYIGIDQKITSKEALLLAQELFDSTHIVNHKSVTFHPKIYVFKGASKGQVILGSNNLTSGGLETNFEAAAIIDYDLTIDDDNMLFQTYWESLKELSSTEHGISTILTPELIDLLAENNLLAIENRAPGEASSSNNYQPRHSILNDLFESKFTVTRPTSQRTSTPASSIPASPTAASTPATASASSAFETFIIQIKPHDNGEVFLSKLAVNENPAFFGYPFTGSTVPKRATNPSYPQRDPDPVINLIAYGANGKQLITLSNYHLNTVYYSTKSEIRITCSPIVGVVPEYSVMIMNRPISPSDIDYEVIIHTPDSPAYQSWVDQCTNRMPGGGKAPRAYGWL